MAAEPEVRDCVLAVHGGLAAKEGAESAALWVEACRKAVVEALARGRKILAAGGSALDAVSAAVCVLEDDPHFDAGRGSALNAEGRQEMDAAVMDGKARRAGAVAGLFGPQNPVLAARAVMEGSPHVLLVGNGALAFCRKEGLVFRGEDYFRTEHAAKALEERLARRLGLGAKDRPQGVSHGTVGALALDLAGNLAAATSTGGITGKAPGRVGDSPIIGAGTYADNETCAVSATGQGEFFMRSGAAFDLAARLKYKRETLAEAAAGALDAVAALGGSGGLIALDKKGALALIFKGCAGMVRGYVRGKGAIFTAIYGEEPRES